MSLSELKSRIEKIKEEAADLAQRSKARIQRKIQEKQQEQAAFWVRKILTPYLKGVADGQGLNLHDATVKLIEDGKTIDALLQEHHDKVQPFLDHPATRVLLSVAQRYVRVDNEGMVEGAKWLLENVVKQENPIAYKAMSETEGGVEWFTDSLKGLQRLIRG